MFEKKLFRCFVRFCTSISPRLDLSPPSQGRLVPPLPLLPLPPAPHSHYFAVQASTRRKNQATSRQRAWFAESGHKCTKRPRLFREGWVQTGAERGGIHEHTRRASLSSGLSRARGVAPQESAETSSVPRQGGAVAGTQDTTTGQGFRNRDLSSSRAAWYTSAFDRTEGPAKRERARFFLILSLFVLHDGVQRARVGQGAGWAVAQGDRHLEGGDGGPSPHQGLWWTFVCQLFSLLAFSNSVAAAAATAVLPPLRCLHLVNQVACAIDVQILPHMSTRPQRCFSSPVSISSCENAKVAGVFLLGFSVPLTRARSTPC